MMKSMAILALLGIVAMSSAADAQIGCFTCTCCQDACMDRTLDCEKTTTPIQACLRDEIQCYKDCNASILCTVIGNKAPTKTPKTLAEESGASATPAAPARPAVLQSLMDLQTAASAVHLRAHVAFEPAADAPKNAKAAGSVNPRSITPHDSTANLLPQNQVPGGTCGGTNPANGAPSYGRCVMECDDEFDLYIAGHCNGAAIYSPPYFACLDQYWPIEQQCKDGCVANCPS
jgi:hypothetical protein